MIHYLVTASGIRPMQSFLEGWGNGLASRIRITPYEALLEGEARLPEHGCVYVFTNLARLSQMAPEARSALNQLHDRLVKTNGAAKVLNDPARSLLRYDLLRCLHQNGINSFNAFRTTDHDMPTRFPVFVRNEVAQNIPPVIARDPQQYAALIQGIKWLHGSLRAYITIEFCDTSDAHGVFRKYGAFVIGKRIVPRHIYYSGNWYMRFDDLTDAEKVREELAFLHQNPHAETLKECARLSGFSYGRLDYGLLGGRPQIWEMNTNAGLVIPPARDLPQRKAVHLKFVQLFSEAMIALDEATN